MYMQAVRVKITRGISFSLSFASTNRALLPLLLLQGMPASRPYSAAHIVRTVVFENGENMSRVKFWKVKVIG